MNTNHQYWNGCWEINDVGRAICRWVLVWDPLDKNFAGCIGGDSGGGSFQLERFVCRDGECFIESDRDLTKNCSKEELDSSDNCQDLLLDAHDESMWSESDNLVLRDIYMTDLVKDGKLLTGGIQPPMELLPLFEKVGLISQPK